MTQNFQRKSVENFVANGPDDLHCMQATFAMVVEAMTGEILTPKQAEEMTKFEPDKATWPFHTFLALADEFGLYVVDDEEFDVLQFLDDPVGALLGQNADEEVTKEHMASLNEADMESARLCVKSEKVVFTNSSPSLSDLRIVDELGGVSMCQVNARKLVGRDGYSSHIVLVEGLDDEGRVVVQDPGLPPQPNLKLTFSQFEHAWLDPSPEMANLMVVLPNEGALTAYLQRRGIEPASGA